jgi:hypothetical protein
LQRPLKSPCETLIRCENSIADFWLFVNALYGHFTAKISQKSLLTACDFKLKNRQ